MQEGWGSGRVAGMKNDSPAQRSYTPEERFLFGYDAYRASGLALGSFAEQHGLSRNRLHYWVYDRRYAQPFEPTAAAPSFRKFKTDAGQPTQSWAVGSLLPTGAVAPVHGGGDTAWVVNSVLEALLRPC